MRLIFEEETLDDLQSIFTWIAKDNPRAAERLINRILLKLELLLTPGFARMGRLGRDPGTYELVERPYIVVYEFASSATRSSCSRFFMARGTGVSPVYDAGCGGRRRRT